MCQAGLQGLSTLFHWLSPYFRCHCGGSGPEAKNQLSARMYMNLGHSLCGFGRGWNWGSGPTLRVRSHPPSTSAFASLAFSTCPVTLGFEGWQEEGWSGEAGMVAKPPEFHWEWAQAHAEPPWKCQSGLSKADRG